MDTGAFGMPGKEPTTNCKYYRRRLMKKIFCLTGLIALCISAIAKDYNIRSLDGQSKKISVVYGDNADVIISYQKNSIHLEQVSSVDTEAIVKGQFLKLAYTQAKSNAQLLLLVALRQEILYEAAHIICRTTVKDESNKPVTATLAYGITGDGPNSYQLNIPELRYGSKILVNADSIAHIKFNTTVNVFMNRMVNLHDTYTMRNADGKTTRQFIDITSPIIEAAISKHCYINKHWYDYDPKMKILIALNQ